jgi:hypothetical protein
VTNPFNPFGPQDPFDPQGMSQDAPPPGPNPFGPVVNPFASQELTPSATPPPQAPGGGARKYLVITAVVVLVLALVGVGVWVSLGLRGPAAPAPTHTAAPTAPSSTLNVPSPTAQTPAAPTSEPPPPEDPGSVVADLLKNVSVVAELPQLPGYERSCSPGKGCVFGPAWTDTEHTGCDTRNRVLGKQLVDVQFKPGTRECKVVSGLLHDPYTGVDMPFGGDASADIQIDHVFALARAWDAGAANWTLEQRVQFANDTANLLAVSGKQNGSKSDDGPGTWMPPNQAFGCNYVTIYLMIAAKYQLAVTQDDEAEATRACAA